MRKGTLALLAVGLLLLGVETDFAQQDIEFHPECPHCGMDRQQFAHSRMLIEYEDGTRVGLCSIRCAALDLTQNSAKKPKSIMVAAYNTKELTDAQEAYWVMGGSQRGVMTRNPKWAFETMDDAEAFMSEYGGESVSFEQALEAAKEELAARKK